MNGAERSFADTAFGRGGQVTYFKQRRVMEYNKKQTLEKLKAEGARSMPEGMGPPQSPGRPV